MLLTKHNNRSISQCRYYTCLIFSFLFMRCTSAATESPHNEQVAPARPNILWLVAEDMSPYLACYGDSTAKTPHLDRLAQEGIVYTNVYSVSGVCAPSRSAIATGSYPTSIGTLHMRTGGNAEFLPEGVIPYSAVLPPEVKMHSEYLRQAGYYCTNNAKEDYQFTAPLTAWDESSKNAHWRNRPKGKPFFAIFNFEVCHESGMWRNAEHPLLVHPDSVPVWPYYPDTPAVRDEIARMYSNVMEMDQQVGEILQQLEEDGLMDSTIIVFYADHGGPLPRQKRELYDTGLKVPMIIRYPQQQEAGSSDDQLISFVDLAPTLLSMAGVPPPAYLHGQAFAGKYRASSPRKYVYAARDRLDDEYDMVRAVRDQRFKYFRNYQPEKPYIMDIDYRLQMKLMQWLNTYQLEGQLDEQQALWFRKSKPTEELYDLNNDPYELNNLALDPQYKDKLEELRKVHKQWQQQYGDQGFIPEPELLQMMWPNLEQPTTEEPSFHENNQQISIHCDTEGASIAYQIKNEQGEEVFDHWQVYSTPLSLQQGQTLVAIAERIGYKRSREVKWDDPTASQK